MIHSGVVTVMTSLLEEQEMTPSTAMTYLRSLLAPPTAAMITSLAETVMITSMAGTTMIRLKENGGMTISMVTLTMTLFMVAEVTITTMVV